MEYEELVKVYDELGSTSKRLEKTEIISMFLKKIKAEYNEVVCLLQGRVFPKWDERVLGMSSRLILKVIASVTGVKISDVEELWKKKGDLGIVAEELISRKKQTTLDGKKLTVKKVFENLKKLADLEGEGTVNRKVSLVGELLSSASSKESKYIINTVLNTLRVGVAEGVLRDAIAKAFNQDNSEVERAYNLSNDYSVVLEAAREGSLGKVKFGIGTPIKVMLALKEENVGDAFERTGRPAEIEYKLDGARLQCHKDKSKILLFTRRLENVTKQFPDVIENIKKNVKGDSFILDSEAVGFDPRNGKYLPFQNISQRIKRKYDIEAIAKRIPVELNVFDVLYYNGKSYIEKPFIERRKLIEKIIRNEKRKIVVVKGLIIEKDNEAEKFYKESLNAGNEGVMFKTLNAPYQAGARVGYMVKLKNILEPLDLVIVKAEYGEGKRSGLLSSYTIACKSGDELLEIGKVSTGLKEKEEEGVTFRELTRLLKPLIQKGKGKEVIVKPEIVLEIGYEEIQKSPSYNSGYALRFPRFLNLRFDKPVSEIATIDDIEKIYKKARKLKS